MWIKNGRVYTQGQWVACDIELENGKIKTLGTCPKEAQLDAQGKTILPGLIDMHVHLREPGFTHKETIATGTKAALAGGFTTIAAMPNVNPVPDNVETARAYQALLKEHALCNVIPYGALTVGLQGQTLSDMAGMQKLGYRLFTDDGKGIQNPIDMEQAMQIAKQIDVNIVAHCEEEALLAPHASVHAGAAKRLGLVPICSESETKPFARDVELVKRYGTSYHVCHLSAKESVEVLRVAKANHLPVSGEVCVHHLLLSEEDVVDANYKMNPPLRSREDQKALRKGIADGTIDMIVSDHAPHTEVEKAKGMASAPFGIVGLETNFPLAYTYLVKTGELTLEQLIALMSTNPAKRFGLTGKGDIAVGMDADLVIVDLEKSYPIDKHTFYSLGQNTPFHGVEVFGSVEVTIVAGKVRYTK
ncbi:MAG: dihydroorotase [Erysipelotrichaceae bacterium]